MAYNLPFEKKTLAIHALAEGSSIRSVERLTGVHRDTIMRLGVRVGEACAALHDERVRNLNCNAIQVDEIWGFIGKKQKNVGRGDIPRSHFGDVWTFVAIDAETKLVPAFVVGKRDSYHAQALMDDLAKHVNNRPQISSDALTAYREASERGFGCEVDYGQIVKTFSVTVLPKTPAGRYSPAEVVSTSKHSITGNPDRKRISTSYVERSHLTARMHVRRLTRLTNAFSKKRENFEAAIALHFAYYNFVRQHQTLRMTPAMAAGVTDRMWTIADLVSLSER